MKGRGIRMLQFSPPFVLVMVAEKEVSGIAVANRAEGERRRIQDDAD
jgi:hypothetical protein